MTVLHCIMPMAGLGTRTRDFSPDPKPFIKIAGIPLFRYALNGMPISDGVSLTYVLNLKDIRFCQERGLALLQEFTPKDIPYDVVFTQTTSGQAETVAKAILDRGIEGQILIGNSDTLVSSDFPPNLEAFDGALGVFESTNQGLSYLRQVDGLVVETAEKVVISNQASSGLYYFRSSRQFLDLFRGRRSLGESYVAPMYNDLIQRNGRVSFWEHKFVHPLGTTSEILEFEKRITADSSVLVNLGIDRWFHG